MYAFRCTEQQFNDSLAQIEQAGDTLVEAVFKGGRDWMLICRKAGTSGTIEPDGFAEVVAGANALLADAKRTLQVCERELRTTLARIQAVAERSSAAARNGATP